MNIEYTYSYSCKPELCFKHNIPLIKLTLSDDGFGNLIGSSGGRAGIYFDILFSTKQCREMDAETFWFNRIREGRIFT